MRIICVECGYITTEKEVKKYNRKHGFVSQYTPPCFKCGCTQFIIK